MPSGSRAGEDGSEGLMAVYVDDMYRYPIGRFGRMKMSHMLADTKSELLAMARRIGVAERWIQRPNDPKRCHFDIALSKRRLAVQAGAIEITFKEAGSHVTDVTQ